MEENKELTPDEKAMLDILAMKAIIIKERDVAMKNKDSVKVHRLTEDIERLNMAFLSAAGAKTDE